eukprot:5079772-Pyramimonas_sp.AAC.1
MEGAGANLTSDRREASNVDELKQQMEVLRAAAPGIDAQIADGKSAMTTVRPGAKGATTGAFGSAGAGASGSAKQGKG